MKGFSIWLVAQLLNAIITGLFFGPEFAVLGGAFAAVLGLPCIFLFAGWLALCRRKNATPANAQMLSLVCLPLITAVFSFGTVAVFGIYDIYTLAIPSVCATLISVALFSRSIGNDMSRPDTNSPEPINSEQ